MKARPAVGVCVAAAMLASIAVAHAATATTATTATAAETVPREVKLLDVPYVPQSEALCGGAALAMVLRYWGEPGVHAEDFAPLVERTQGGIRAAVLTNAVQARGWTAIPLQGAPAAAEVEREIAGGRPVIALIRTGSGAGHYVVSVGWANGWVIFHDPSVGPYRVVREGEFVRAWSGSGCWALLVLPNREFAKKLGSDAARPDSTARPAGLFDGCDAMVEEGIILAQQGDTAEANERLLAAQALYPTSAAPLRERAGLRFRAADWAGASRLAEQALRLDPRDDLSWRLLAGSRFLNGDPEGALRAWNHLLEPRTDLTHIDGLTRIRYSAVADQVDLPPGRILTPGDFRRARRRLAEMPAQSESSLSLRPLPDGSAQIDVTLAERPLVFDGRWEIGSAGIKALVTHEITLPVASLTGNGELLNAGFRWQKNRPRVSLEALVPAAGGRPGIWRLDGLWERQSYGARSLSDPDVFARAGVVREERRRTGLSFSDWLGPDLRAGAGVALDEWVGRGPHLSLTGNVKTLLARDRLAIGTWMARWIRIARGSPFGAGGLSVRWRSQGTKEIGGWQGLLGLSSATSEAPLSLWSGAGTGSGRDPLLRAHPLLKDGIVWGRVFGRTLAHGTIEREALSWGVGPVRVGWAFFMDAARPWDTGRSGRVPWLVDGGTGLRLGRAGMKGYLRIDGARGFEDGNSALSVGWEFAGSGPDP